MERKGPMNYTYKSTIAAICVSSALFLGSGTDLWAKERSPQVCTKALVSGMYGFNARGLVVEDGAIDVEERQAGIGRVKLRRNGTATFTVTRFFAGVPEIPDEDQPITNTFEATWTVNPDCTGSVILMEEGIDVDWVFVAVKDANEVHFISGAGIVNLTKIGR